MVAIKEETIKKEDALFERLKREELQLLQANEEYETTHLWEFLSPYRWQAKLPRLLKDNHLVLAPAPNGIGKTLMAICILCSWVEGYEAWSEVDADYLDAVKVGKKWFRPSSLGVKPPVKIRVTGEDWQHHLNEVVVDAMKTWFPSLDFHTKKNSNGVKYFWTHIKNGSTIELMTHGQEVKFFEGWRGHGWMADEPPPYAVFKAMARGLHERRGKILIMTTPLREDWMLDELVLKNRTDIAIMKDLTLYDNEGSFDNDNGILDELGIEGKRTKYWNESDGQKKHFFDLILYEDDMGVEAEKYLRETAMKKLIVDGKEGVGVLKGLDKKINDLIFLRKAKDTSLDEKPSRFFGLFKKLVGLVIKEFDKNIHILPAFDIPTNWVVSFQIDFHLSKPIALAFYACDEHNRHFVIEEVWDKITPEEIADLIIRRKKVNCWNITHGEIDPLSKGDIKYVSNRGIDIEDAFSVLEERLDAEGIEFNGAIKDPMSGYTNIRKWLKGPNRIPILYFFDSLQSVANEAYGHVYEIQRLCFDDNDKVEKKNDHFMECLYRYTLMGVEYKEKPDEALEPVGAGSQGGQGWMG